MSTVSRNMGWVVTAAVLMWMLFVSSCQRFASPVAPTQIAGTPNSHDDEFKILDRKHVNEILVFNVTMRNLDAAKAMAEALIQSNKQESMIRVFFHETGLADGMGNAPLLYEWTGQTGLVLRYDLRLPTPKESLNQSFPEYKVLSKKKSVDKRVSADILVPSLSDRTSAKEIERVCRIICYEEGLDDCAFYTTMDAYNAGHSDMTGQDSPAKSKQGVLCVIQDGKFILSARP